MVASRLHPFSNRLRVAASAVIGILALGSLTGCSKVESIEHYTVAKPAELAKLTGGELPPTSATSAAPTASKPGRMLAAIVLKPGKGWFFKLSGAADAVATQRDAFDAFLRSVHFDEGAAGPQWTTPSGWRDEHGSGMRYATLKIDGSQKPDDAAPLELSVTSLGRDEQTTDTEYVLSNVNRWREQLKLPKIKADALDANSQKVELADGSTATAVDISGTLGSDGMTRPPFAGMAGPAAGPLPSVGPKKSPPADAIPPEHFVAGKVPESWKAQSNPGMHAIDYRIAQDDHKARVTVTRLAERGNELLPNVNRWRGQVGLNEVIADELTTEAKPIKVGGKPAHYVELLPPEEGLKGQAILGAIVYDAGQAWFFKWMGDVELVESERDAFRKFVTSSKIESGN
ncbi:MAG TPA: hypothetical protein VHV77_09810 [Pirellulales bacterium]|jgi:hypothetical protein|nr:hypothetical protein [Pirellulales bacterium]